MNRKTRSVEAIVSGGQAVLWPEVQQELDEEAERTARARREAEATIERVMARSRPEPPAVAEDSEERWDQRI